jgi:hypothetical protein
MRTLVVSLFGFFFAFLATVFVFVYWEDTQTIMQFEKISLLSANQSIEQRLVANPGEHLVPKGAFKGANDIDEILYVYEVSVDAGYTINPEVVKLTLIRGNEQTEDEYRMFIFSSFVSIKNEIAYVTISVSLRMPTSQVEADSVKGVSAMFTMKFIQIP